MSDKKLKKREGWINDTDRCWICKRTRKEVYEDSYPHGDLFNGETDEERILNVFEKEGIEVVCEKFPICRICQYILDVRADASARQCLRDVLDACL